LWVFKYFFLLLAVIIFNGCTSEVDIALNHFDMQKNVSLTSESITASNITNDTENVIVLSYISSDGESATACELSDLVNLIETTTCSCDTGGVCKVGVAGESGFVGDASFNYIVKVNQQESNISEINFEITPTTSKYFLYSSNNGSGNISITSYNTTTNKLTFVENDNVAPTSPEKMVVVGDNFYIAGNWVDNKLTHYKIDPNSGLLTKQADYTDPIDPRTLTVKDDKFIYMVNFLSPGKINKYEINPDGSLGGHVQVDSSTTKPRGIAAHPNLDVLYAPGMWNWRVYEYAIDPTNGNLTEGVFTATQNDPNWVEVNNAGTYAYVTNGGNSTFSVYSINQATGALTYLNNYSSQGAGPYMVELNQDSSCLYINNHTEKELAVFSHAAGVPTYISSLAYAYALGEIVIKGDKLFASSMDGKIRVYNIEVNCTLTLEDTADTAGTSAFGLTIYAQ
jgi:6-phosphogluconolactonase (cycloisomerase 2 family)